MHRPLEVGFYGKLPSHGDFLRRRVADAFVGVWDGWLQDCLAASREALADRWLDVYLTSPAWRFGCAPGACGPLPVAGVLVPSVDRVGRYFPLTIVAELPDSTSLVTTATQAGAFFDLAERLLIQTLESEHVDFGDFDEQVSALANELAPAGSQAPVAFEPAAAGVLSDNGQASWQIPLGSPAQLGRAFEELLSHRLSAIYDPLVLWWTDGSSIVEPSCLITKGLPHPDTFAALLDGSWARRRWRSIPTRAEVAPAAIEMLVDAAIPPRFRSAAATDVGKVREVNQDSFLERSEVGLWAVADGLGGHQEGEVASRMVCDALADFSPDAGFEETIEAAVKRLRDVNAHLQRAANREVNPVRSGSTVVALLARGTRGVVLWAGDSRAYRWRGGVLEQLTQDHSVGGQTSTAITRAVGGEATLAVDLHRDRIRPGDRFLLCSDGLTRVVPEPQIRASMEHQDIRFAVDSLVRAALDAGGPDNVTVMIVEAFT
ncbi:MAG: type VI secretion system-associated protein TagF [Vicinamibacterales bacterium]